MSKGLKVVAGSLLALLALIVVVASVLVVRFDADHWKSQLSQRVERLTGRKLALGQLALSVYPNVGLQVAGLSLSEPLAGKKVVAEEFLAVEQARVSVRLLPLLSAQLIVDEVELKGLSARIVRYGNGRFNFADLEALIRQDGEVPAENGKTGSASPPASSSNEQLVFDVAGLRIADAKISYRDEASGRELVASRIALTTGRLGRSAQGKLYFATTLAGVKPDLSGQTHLAADYQFDLPRREVRFDKLEFKLNGHLASLQDADIELGLARLSLRQTDQATASLVFSGLNLAARGQWQGDKVDIKLDAPRFEWDGVSGGGQDVHLQAHLAGKGRKADLKLDLTGLHGAAAQLDMQRVNMQFDARDGERRIKGHLATPLVWRSAARSFSLPALEGQFEWADPALPVAQLLLPLTGQASGQMQGVAAAGASQDKIPGKTPGKTAGNTASPPRQQPARLALNLKSSLDGSPIHLDAHLSAGEIPALDFDLDVARLDVNRYLGKKTDKVTLAKNDGAAAGDKEVSGAGPQAAAEAPLSLDWLRQVRVNGTVQVGEVLASGLKMSTVRLKIQAEEGRLAMAPYSAQLYQGQLDGRLLLEAGTATEEGAGAEHRLQIKQTLRGIAINPLLQDALQRDALEGRGNLDFDLSSRGVGPQSWRQQLQGRLAVDLQNGAIKGFNLAQALRETRTLLSGKIASASPDAAKKTDFSELKASFAINQGVADNRDFSLKAPLLRVTGAGQIDLARETIDYLARASVVNTTKGQGGKELSHLRGLNVPVRLSGTFAAPEWQVDAAGLLKSGTKEVLSRKVEEKLENQLGEKAPQIKVLKGLFGR